MDQAPTERRGIEHKLALLVLTLSALAPFALAALLVPDARGHSTHEQLGLLPCMPMARWGVPCPGCGVTTSVTHFGRLELLDSLRVQPLGFSLALGALVALPWAWYLHLRGRDLAALVKQQLQLRWAALAAGWVLVCWIYKLVVVLAPRS